MASQLHGKTQHWHSSCCSIGILKLVPHWHRTSCGMTMMAGWCSLVSCLRQSKPSAHLLCPQVSVANAALVQPWPYSDTHLLLHNDIVPSPTTNVLENLPGHCLPLYHPLPLKAVSLGCRPHHLSRANLYQLMHWLSPVLQYSWGWGLAPIQVIDSGKSQITYWREPECIIWDTSFGPA